MYLFKVTVKLHKPICGTLKIAEDVKEPYFIAYAEFATFEDWRKALQVKDPIILVETTQYVPKLTNRNDVASVIDQIFAEKGALGRPLSTYVYSIIISNCSMSVPVQEIVVVSTNNRYLQHHDHQLLTYNLMKICNFFRVPIIQFVADVDSGWVCSNESSSIQKQE